MSNKRDNKKRRRNHSHENKLQKRGPRFSNLSGADVGVKLSSMVETDHRKLSSRQKQIDYGKNTIGYTNYLAKIPKFEILQFYIFDI